jgi:hypothetical protein
MSSDIRSILERMAAVEGKLTPVSVKHGLNPQQSKVPQLPALLKPRKISVLGSNTDPEHPFKNYAVGANESRNALEEAMQEVEEDMLSKVKKDLTKYLDKLEQKVKVDRELKDKAKDAVTKHKAEEEIDEDDYELSDPETVHGIEDKVDTQLANPQQPVKNMESEAVKTYAMENGMTIECCGDEQKGFVLRRDGREMPTRFKNIDHADMAVKLFQKRMAQKNKQAQTMSNQDYLDER